MPTVQRPPLPGSTFLLCGTFPRKVAPCWCLLLALPCVLMPVNINICVDTFAGRGGRSVTSYVKNRKAEKRKGRQCLN